MTEPWAWVLLCTLAGLATAAYGVTVVRQEAHQVARTQRRIALLRLILQAGAPNVN